jgi:phospholipase C
MSIAMFQFAFVGPLAGTAQADPQSQGQTRTPIKHVIVIIGENRTFDHIFATYVPKRGNTIDNLLSKGIVKSDGTPGPFYWLATQNSAQDTSTYEISPFFKTPYKTLPAPLTGGPSNVCTNNGICTLAEAQASENGLSPNYYQFLLTGGTGQASDVPDARIQNVNNLPPGPFQLTSSTFSYDDYAASPVHRFYQMWQQLDCSAQHFNFQNPGGCKADLFPWVEVTVGAGTNGKPQPAGFNNLSTGEGSTSMGFYNVQNGDAPYLKSLADTYAMSDNYHQAVMGGTGANHIMLGTGDAMWFSDGNGNPAVPPENVSVYQPPDQGTVNEIEDPNPAPGTNNWYTEDGYGGGGYGSPVYGGGSYTD